MRSDLVHNIDINVLSDRKVLNAIAKSQANFAQAALHAVVKHVNYIPLHLEFFCSVLSDKETAFQAHCLLCVEETDVELEHFGQDGDRNVDH